MTTAVAPEFARVVTQYRGAVAAVNARVAQFLTRQWGSLGAYRDADAEMFVNRILPMVIGGQRQVASLTDAYLALLARQLLGEAGPTGVATAVVTGEALRGVDPVVVYQRPFKTVWWQIAQGTPFGDAVRIGGDRLTTIALTDLQLARTHTAREVMQRDDRIVGFRRVVTGVNTCDLCDIASTQRYHVEDLMPIHAHCSCDVEPIYGTRDPGQVIDRAKLDDIKAAALVREHGEVGPVLVHADHAFRGPDDIF